MKFRVSQGNSWGTPEGDPSPATHHNGETAMDYAIFGGYDVIAQLLQNGTCVDIDVNEDERLAALQKQNRILQLLESYARGK